MGERVPPTMRTHVLPGRGERVLGDENLHDYVRAGLSGEMLWRIERRIAQDAPAADRLERLAESLGRLNAKMAEMLHDAGIDASLPRRRE